ncbi:MAG: iron-containing alcohol dehydrogenase [Phycisphaerae bacterium]|nr:iron-containing alcohol dehydrogenase [Phycisphaerae bacterium]
MDRKQQAIQWLTRFKGDAYVHGLGCFGRLGEHTAALGHRAVVVTSGVGKSWGPAIHDATRASLEKAGVALAGELVPGARPNAPFEDVFRIAEALAEQQPDVVVAVGGGSVIDAVKAANAYRVLGDRYPDLAACFGVGQVTHMLEATGRHLLPCVAAQLASGSAAHLTKYSNVTDMAAVQKMLIIDEAVVPTRCLFDYAMTTTMSPDFTADGGFDGVSHCLEVLVGATDTNLPAVQPVALLGIELIISHLKTACHDPEDLVAREAIGLGTDLGGYAIMLGGTSGAHLTSFSLVDLLPHGRACALLNPYYMVFYAPAIEARLRAVGQLYRTAGYGTADLDRLHGRDLGVAVAEAMLTLAKDVGFPTTLAEVPGFTPAHIDRAIQAARHPSLESKLRNMPVPLSPEMLDDYMRPVLEAAMTGRFQVIRNMA